MKTFVRRVWPFVGLAAASRGARSSHAPPIGDAAIGAAFSRTRIYAPTAFGKTVAVDDFIFLVGGKASVFGSGVARVASTAVAGDAARGAWTPRSSLRQGRTDMAVTLAGDFLYGTGGGLDGPGLDAAYAAQVRF
jgi:hypothetical protein